MVQHLRLLAQARDILHMHKPDPLAAAAVWLTRLALPLVLPLVLHWHSDRRKYRTMVLYESLLTWQRARADAIVGTGEADAKASVPLRPWLDKVNVIHIGISDSLVRTASQGGDAIRRRFGGRRQVFAPGHMTSHKGLDVLVEATARRAELQSPGTEVAVGHLPERPLSRWRQQFLELLGRRQDAAV